MTASRDFSPREAFIRLPIQFTVRQGGREMLAPGACITSNVVTQSFCCFLLPWLDCMYVGEWDLFFLFDLTREFAEQRKVQKD